MTFSFSKYGLNDIEIQTSFDIAWTDETIRGMRIEDNDDIYSRNIARVMKSEYTEAVLIFIRDAVDKIQHSIAKHLSEEYTYSGLRPNLQSTGL